MDIIQLTIGTFHEINFNDISIALSHFLFHIVAIRCSKALSQYQKVNLDFCAEKKTWRFADSQEVTVEY